MISILIREEFGDWHTQRGECLEARHRSRRMTGTETGASQPQGRSAWGLQRQKRQKDLLLESVERTWPYQHLDVGLLASRTVRE